MSQARIVAVGLTMAVVAGAGTPPASLHAGYDVVLSLFQAAFVSQP